MDSPKMRSPTGHRTIPIVVAMRLSPTARATWRESDTPVLPRIANAWDMFNTVRSRPHSGLSVSKAPQTMPVMERVRLFKGFGKIVFHAELQF